MFFAICPGCGRKKRRPDVRCRGCGLDPSTDHDVLVRSVYLSIWRYEKSDERIAYAQVLRNFSADLHAGKQLAFEPAELEQLAERLRQVRAIPKGEIWRAGAKLFLQVFFIVLGLVIILGLVHMMRSRR